MTWVSRLFNTLKCVCVHALPVAFVLVVEGGNGEEDTTAGGMGWGSCQTVFCLGGYHGLLYMKAC